MLFNVRGDSLPKSRVDKAVEDFIAIPVVALLGIYIAALLVDSMLHVNNQTFVLIFTGVGGVPFLIIYFKKKIAEYMG